MEGGRLVRIISGGQTGVDRAALDVAMARGLPCGGWVPRGRRAEDGRLPLQYPMRESRRNSYEERTRLNVRDADGTLILTRGRPIGGTALTAALAQRLGKPCLLVDLENAPDPATINQWIDERHPGSQRRWTQREHLPGHLWPSGSPAAHAAAIICIRLDQI